MSTVVALPRPSIHPGDEDDLTLLAPVQGLWLTQALILTTPLTYLHYNIPVQPAIKTDKTIGFYHVETQSSLVPRRGEQELATSPSRMATKLDTKKNEDNS